MNGPHIRLATLGDAEIICTIYNQGIEDRLATLETERRTPAERREWLAGRGPRHPVFVAEVDGVVVGWASSTSSTHGRRTATWPTYRSTWNASWRGRGVGGRLLAHLADGARPLGYHKLVLAAFPFNRAGMALLRALGLPHGGDLSRAGGTRRSMGGCHRDGTVAVGDDRLSRPQSVRLMSTTAMTAVEATADLREALSDPRCGFAAHRAW